MIRPLALAALVAVALAIPAGAASTQTFKGRATSTDKSFKYGKVTVKRKGSKVTSVKIESVTTTGCGGFMTLVFTPSDKDLQIVSGSARIKDGKLSVKYRPDRSVDDQTTTLKAKFKGSSVSGTFSSGSLCVNKGRFSAKR